MKKFFKKTEGFTLVELIVVIAILGILAGVGTVGYSGYIKKANIAADEQIMAVINQSFIAACTEVGVKPIDVSVTGTDVDDEDKTFVLGEVNAGPSTFALRAAESKGDKIEAAFAKYFKGNEGSKFKYYDTMTYIPGVGFKGSNSEVGLADGARGNRKDYSGASADYMADGTSYKNNEVALIGTVTQFSSAFSDFIADGGRADKLLKDPTFAKFCKDNGIATSDPNQVGTAMVMYAAQELSDLDSSVVYGALKNSYSTEDGYDILKMSQAMHGTNGSKADMALDGAVLAAAIAGYANSEYGKNNTAVQEAYAGYAGVTDVVSLDEFINNVINAGKDDEGNDSFAAYLNSQAAKDMQAFTGGLGAVYHGTDALMGAYGTADFDALLVNILQGNWSPAA